MPYVNVQVTPAATREQKRALVADITRSLVERLGKTPEQIHIVIQNTEEENWGFAGQLPPTHPASNGQRAPL
ncbi:MAG: 4-oxalocrotonate tautomerase family protein [Devosia sp.]